MSYGALDYMAMFGCSFATVFLLGIQSKNVNASRYVAAIVTSLGISIANFTFIKFAAQGSLDVFAVCATGGCSGIAFSIWFYDKFMRPKRTELTQVESAAFRVPDPIPQTPKARMRLMRELWEQDAQRYVARRHRNQKGTT